MSTASSSVLPAIGHHRGASQSSAGSSAAARAASPTEDDEFGLSQPALLPDLTHQRAMKPAGHKATTPTSITLSPMRHAPSTTGSSPAAVASPMRGSASTPALHVQPTGSSNHRAIHLSPVGVRDPMAFDTAASSAVEYVAPSPSLDASTSGSDAHQAQSLDPAELLAELKHANFRAETYKKAHNQLRQHLTASLQPVRIAQLSNRILELEGHLRSVLVENKTLTLEIKKLDRHAHGPNSNTTTELSDTITKQGQTIELYKAKIREFQAHEHEMQKAQRKANLQLTNLETMCKRLTERVQSDAAKINVLQAAVDTGVASAGARSDSTSPVRREAAPLSPGGGIKKSRSNEVPPIQSTPFMDRAALLKTKQLNEEMQLKENERRRLKQDNEKLLRLVDELRAALDATIAQANKEKAAVKKSRKRSLSVQQAPVPASAPTQPSTSQPAAQSAASSTAPISSPSGTPSLSLTTDSTHSDDTGGLSSVAAPTTPTRIRASRKPTLAAVLGTPPQQLRKSASEKKLTPAQREARDAALVAAAAARRLQVSQQKASANIYELNPPPLNPISPHKTTSTFAHHVHESDDGLSVDEFMLLIGEQSPSPEKPVSYAELIDQLARAHQLSPEKKAELHDAAMIHAASHSFDGSHRTTRRLDHSPKARMKKTTKPSQLASSTESATSPTTSTPTTQRTRPNAVTLDPEAGAAIPSTLAPPAATAADSLAAPSSDNSTQLPAAEEEASHSEQQEPSRQVEVEEKQNDDPIRPPEPS